MRQLGIKLRAAPDRWKLDGKVAQTALRPRELGPGCPIVNLPAGLAGAGSMCPHSQLQSRPRGCRHSPSASSAASASGGAAETDFVIQSVHQIITR